MLGPAPIPAPVPVAPCREERFRVWLALVLLTGGCTRMAEHVDLKPAESADTVEIADLEGEWRQACALDLLGTLAQERDIHVQMRLLIPADGTVAAGGVLGVTRFADAACEEEVVYAARPVSYTLEPLELPGQVHVLHVILEDYSAMDPYSAERFIGVHLDLDRSVIYMDTDGAADRAPETEEVTDPEAAWGWFAEDPVARGVRAVRVGEGP